MTMTTQAFYWITVVLLVLILVSLWVRRIR